MQLISPWRSGESRSLFVATVTGDREDLLRIAAPNNLLPEEIFSRVRGTMDDSVMVRRLETNSSGLCAVVMERDLSNLCRGNMINVGLRENPNCDSDGDDFNKKWKFCHVMKVGWPVTFYTFCLL